MVMGRCRPPSPLRPSPPSSTTEISRFNTEDDYWAAVPEIDDSEFLCDLLSGISLTDLDNEAQHVGRHTTNSTRSFMSSQRLPTPVRRQEPPPSSLSARSRDRGPFSASSPGATPSPSPRVRQFASPELQSPARSRSGHQSPSAPKSASKRQQKFYVVTRGRQVGVFDDWYVCRLYSAPIFSISLPGLRFIPLSTV